VRPGRPGAATALLRAVALLVAVVVGILLLAPPASAAPGESGPAEGPVVVVGMTGVRWDDVSAAGTPALYSLLTDGATANLISRSVRSWACPADGWLAASAGRRAADLPMETWGTCRVLYSPGSDGVVPGWSDYVRAAQEGSYDAVPGLLGESLAARGVRTLGIGPGAAIALASYSGVPVGEWQVRAAAPESLAQRVAAGLAGHDLVVVDAGTVRDRNRPLVWVEPGALQDGTDEEPAGPDLPDSEDWILSAPTRAEQVASVEGRVAAIIDAVRATSPDAVVLVVSLADSGTVPRMQLAGMLGGEGPVPGVLGSSSTRQYAMVQATDVAPTIMALVTGETLPAMPGTPMTTTGPAPDSHLFRLVDAAEHSLAVRPLVPGFFTVLVVVNLLLYAAAALGMNRTILRAMQASAPRRAALGRALLRPDGTTRLLRGLRIGGPVVAALPVASYLANLVPWWRSGSPGLVLWALVVAIALALGALALLGPWRRHLLSPIVVVAGFTSLVLVADVLTGATLQVSALMGVQPLVGGRFYGFNNSSFALHASASILVAMCAAEPLARRGHRWPAAALVAVIGVTATVLDGHPSIGADFGGPPALIPAFAILVLLTLEVRITWRRLGLVLGVSALLAISFSVLDWLRPPEQRTHLGNFIQTVLDGGLWNVIARKAGQNLTNLFGSTLTLLAIAGVIVLVVVVARPLGRAARAEADDDAGSGGRWGARFRAGYDWLRPRSTMARLEQDAVMLRPGVIALATAWTIGFALNDSGVVVPAIGMSLAVPLLLAVVATWLLRVRVANGPGIGARESLRRS